MASETHTDMEDASTGIALRDSRLLMLPGTAEVFDLEVPGQAVTAVQRLRSAEANLADMRRAAEHALVQESIRVGKKTLRFAEAPGMKVEISGGPGATMIDPEILRRELEAAGCPDERIREAIKEEITYTANRSVCNQLAGANPAYKAAVETATVAFEKRYGVGVKTI